MHESEREVAQSCPTLSGPMDCSPPGSSIHGIFQARRVLEWAAIALMQKHTTQKISREAVTQPRGSIARSPGWSAWCGGHCVPKPHFLRVKCRLDQLPPPRTVGRMHEQRAQPRVGWHSPDPGHEHLQPWRLQGLPHKLPESGLALKQPQALCKQRQ